MSRVTRTHRPDIKEIWLMNGITVELNDNQSWYETDKCYEIWHDKASGSPQGDGPDPLPHRVTYFRKTNVCFVAQHEVKEGPSDPSSGPA
jgi:hypothetical protein